MTNEQKKVLLQLKRDVSNPKHKLLELLRSIEEISPAQGEKLSRIIARLEDWQNK